MELIIPGDSNIGSQEKSNNNDNYCFINSCHANNFLLSTNDPAYQYQTQKKIQNTVRVYSSLYTMNLGALNVYQKPSPFLGIGVNWNQMSDRALPHFQTNSGNSQGSFYHGSSLRHMQTRNRPGAGTPGGYGVDIKHNSYYRYLARLKAKKDIRRGVVPPTFGMPILFNPAFPVYGGKTVKTAIVSGCYCPDNDLLTNETSNKNIYKEYNKSFIINEKIIYEVGQNIYVQLSENAPILTAEIISIDPTQTIFNVNIIDSEGNVEGTEIISYEQIYSYFYCNSCNSNNSCEVCNSGNTCSTSNNSIENGYVANGIYNYY